MPYSAQSSPRDLRIGEASNQLLWRKLEFYKEQKTLMQEALQQRIEEKKRHYVLPVKSLAKRSNAGTNRMYAAKRVI